MPQQLLGLPFGESVMAECLVEVDNDDDDDDGW